MTGTELSEVFALLNNPDTVIRAPGVSPEKCARLRSIALTAIEKLQQAIAHVRDVEDIVGQPGEPCPVQSQYTVCYIRTLLGIGESNGAPKKSHDSDKVTADSTPTLGNGPFRAEIVAITDKSCAIWRSESVFNSEMDAVDAIVAQAKKLKHRTTQWVSHWITEDKEHMVDYGSHTYYGRVTRHGGHEK